MYINITASFVAGVITGSITIPGKHSAGACFKVRGQGSKKPGFFSKPFSSPVRGVLLFFTSHLQHPISNVFYFSHATFLT